MEGVTSGFQALNPDGTYSSGDQPLTQFYVPALKQAWTYDRMAGYFSASVLKAAAVGMVGFIQNAQENGGKMRLIVGAQLSPDDVQAVRDGAKTRAAAIADAVTGTPLTHAAPQPGDEYLTLLGWMVANGLLEIKVGLPVDKKTGQPLSPSETNAYFHSKYGILTDLNCDQIAFLGSENETASGWLYNHETFSVYKSWLTQVWDELGAPTVQRFEKHWNGSPDTGWVVTDLVDVDDRLLKLVPPDYVPPGQEPIWKVLGLPDPALQAALDDLDDLRTLPVRVPFTAALTAPAELLPSQSRLMHRAVTTYPRGYLFADPVGFGKTLELGFTIRELHLSGKASKTLILTPASVLKQWQEELAEKVGLSVPRYTGSGFLDVNDQPIEQPPNTNPWSAFPIVLASSHLARRRGRRRELLAAGGWDIVVVDEAHHARRQGSKATSRQNTLLSLLHSLHDEGAWKALYLASATPMQMNPHEAWDLLALLDLPGRWGKSASQFVAYYEQLRLQPGDRDWAFLSHMAADYYEDAASERDAALEARMEEAIRPVRAFPITRIAKTPLSVETAKSMSPMEQEFLDLWLRRHTPMKDRAFRNTRDLLRAYQDAGIIDPSLNIPVRRVDDEFIALDPYTERPLYDRIERYISRYYNAYMEDGQKALGFIMTIYRRRLTSSFYAIQCSLERRLDALRSGQNLATLVSPDDEAAIEQDQKFDWDNFDISLDRLNAEIAELSEFVAALQAHTGEDSKATQLVTDLAEAFKTFKTVVVFTQYTDTMDYVRERLVTAGYHSVGCYSGRGGEVWNPETKSWDAITKAELKQQFRDERIQILLGTDSMSEGLNLQTSSRLINYDMPWNLMRAEQRIGRIDRIGAARPEVFVSNYFYSDTVEEAVYRGIKEDFADFTDIIGSAQPVLARVEEIIEGVALRGTRDQQADISKGIEEAKKGIRQAANAAVRQSDFDLSLDLSIPEMSPGITVDGIRARLIANPITGPRLVPVDKFVYDLMPVAGSEDATAVIARVTFDRATADAQGIPLLVYGQPLFDSLMKENG